MSIAANQFIEMLINILLFSIVPFGWHIITQKTPRGFLKKAGLYFPKTKHKKEILLIFVGTYIITWLLLFSSVILFQTERDNSAMKNLSNPLYFFLYLFFYGIKTGVSEEIFFRGFVAKNIIKHFGFKKGNIIQSLCFALPHIISISQMGILDTIVRIINAIIFGWVFGYIMSKKANGSIIPGILGHTGYNMLSSFLLSLLLV